MQPPEKRNRALKQKRLAELRQKIASGTEQIAQGKVTDGELIFTKLQEKIRSISESKEWGHRTVPFPYPKTINLPRWKM